MPSCVLPTIWAPFSPVTWAHKMNPFGYCHLWVIITMHNASGITFDIFPFAFLVVFQLLFRMTFPTSSDILVLTISTTSCNYKITWMNTKFPSRFLFLLHNKVQIQPTTALKIIFLLCAASSTEIHMRGDTLMQIAFAWYLLLSMNGRRRWWEETQVKSQEIYVLNLNCACSSFKKWKLVSFWFLNHKREIISCVLKIPPKIIFSPYKWANKGC